MISKIALYRLINLKYYQFMKLVVERVDESDPTVLKIKDARDQVSNLLPDLLKSLSNEAANEETAIIKAFDTLRDNAIMGLIAYLKSFNYHANEDKKEAANLLMLYIRAQGTQISKMNYQAETPALTKIINQFKNEAKYTAALALLGGVDWLEEMETSNESFETRFKSRNTSFSLDKNIPPFGDIKTKTTLLFVELVELIESRFKTTKADKLPTEQYQKLINELNILIGSYLVYTLPATKKKTNPEDPA